MGMRLLVCGGRTFDDLVLLNDILDQIHAKDPRGKGIGCIIHGDAQGADKLAGQWAMDNGVCMISIPANWDKFGAASGPIRNAWMLKYGLPDMVVAFPTADSKGTHDMIKRAKKAGLAVLIFEEETNETDNA